MCYKTKHLLQPYPHCKLSQLTRKKLSVIIISPAPSPCSMFRFQLLHHKHDFHFVPKHDMVREWSPKHNQKAQLSILRYTVGFSFVYFYFFTNRSKVVSGEALFTFFFYEFEWRRNHCKNHIATFSWKCQVCLTNFKLVSSILFIDEVERNFYLFLADNNGKTKEIVLFAIYSLIFSSSCLNTC